MRRTTTSAPTSARASAGIPSPARSIAAGAALPRLCPVQEGRSTPTGYTRCPPFPPSCQRRLPPTIEGRRPSSNFQCQTCYLTSPTPPHVPTGDSWAAGRHAFTSVSPEPPLQRLLPPAAQACRRRSCPVFDHQPNPRWTSKSPTPPRHLARRRRDGFRRSPAANRA
jgi:hypothetical protein